MPVCASRSVRRIPKESAIGEIRVGVSTIAHLMWQRLLKSSRRGTRTLSKQSRRPSRKREPAFGARYPELKQVPGR